MARRRMEVLATLLCALVIATLVAFAARGWIVRATSIVFVVTPTPTSDVGNHIAPDTLYGANDPLRYHAGRAAPQSIPPLP